MKNRLNIIALTQARIGSSRLPRKVLKPVGSETILSLHLNRLRQATLIDQIVVATTHEKYVERIIAIAKESGTAYFQGDTNNVLDRFYQAAKLHKADYVVRLTSDCPLIDPKLIDQVITFTIDRKLDYGSNILIEHFPDGQDIEVFTFKALEKAHQLAQLDSEKEHVTPYIIKRSTFKGGKQFIAENFPSSIDYSAVRMTVDEPNDYFIIKTLVKELGAEASWNEYTQHILNNPAKFTNQKIVRNEGYLNSLNREQNGK